MVDTGAARTQMGWEIHPDGMIDVLAMAHELAPELPLYITENGAAYPDVVVPDGSIDDPERLVYIAATSKRAPKRSAGGSRCRDTSSGR